MRQKERGIECNDTEKSADSAMRQKEECRECNETERCEQLTSPSSANINNIHFIPLLTDKRVCYLGGTHNKLYKNAQVAYQECSVSKVP
jgi:hypothetical protein